MILTVAAVIVFIVMLGVGAAVVGGVGAGAWRILSNLIHKR